MAFKAAPGSLAQAFWIEMTSGVATFIAVPFVLKKMVQKQGRTIFAGTLVALSSLALSFYSSGPLQSLLLELAVGTVLVFSLDFAVARGFLAAKKSHDEADE